MQALIDPETEARLIYERAGLDPDAMPGPIAVAEAIIGASRIIAHRGISAPALWVGSRREIWYNPRLPPAARAFPFAHELGEMRLAELRYQEPDREDVAHSIGAAVSIPRGPMSAELRGRDYTVASLARLFACSQSVMVLRIAEITGIPTALIMSHRIRVRGDLWGWPPEILLREIARGLRIEPRLERVLIGDERRRVALRAA